MLPYTKHKREMVATLENLLSTTPNARKVEYRYKTLRFVLKKAFPGLQQIDDEYLEKVLKDVCYMDRKLRQLTEGEQEKEKEILSQEYVLEELNYTPGYESDVQKLKNITI